jgi:hypothetical protein
MPPLHPRHYRRFLRGKEGTSQIVAFLPGYLGAHIPTLTTEVGIKYEYARKLLEKHGLGHEALGLIQAAIDYGWCTRTRPSSLDFIYIEGFISPRRYILGIKAVPRGSELWVTTLYSCNERELRRRLRLARSQSQVIREHL